MAEFATLADLKVHLNKTSTADDSELTTMLDAAEDIVRSLVGPVAATTVTERVAVVGGTAILSGRPSGAVTVDGGAVSGFTVNNAAGLIYGLPATGWSRHATVSYTVGGGTVPAAVMLATVIIAGHLWETQRSATPGPFAAQSADDPSAPFGVGFAIPNRAKELLGPYLRTSTQVA